MIKKIARLTEEQEEQWRSNVQASLWVPLPHQLNVWSLTPAKSQYFSRLAWKPTTQLSVRIINNRRTHERATCLQKSPWNNITSTRHGQQLHVRRTSRKNGKLLREYISNTSNAMNCSLAVMWCRRTR